MATYLSPGVYVEEVPSAIKAITGVSTSTAAFLGIVPNTVQLVARNPAADPSDPASPPAIFVDFNVPATAKKPILITNWSQFTETFGDLVSSSTTASTVEKPAVNAGYQQLAHAVYGFFNNGGSRCYVARVAVEADLQAALDALIPINEISLVCAPGILTASARDQIISHCAATKDRFAIFDGPQFAPELDSLTRVPVATDPENPTELRSTKRAAAAAAAETPGLMPPRTDLAAWYYPWIRVFDPARKVAEPNSDGTIAVPPSGHIAGIFARVDTERGVFKAPANEVIRGALGVTHLLSKADQDGLNPKGVNCIRVLNNNILVWGARTVGGDLNADLKFINVRRTLLFLRESIEEGTQWAVFEPNTPALWAKISRNVTAFLMTVWRSGALFGTTAQEAFYVKCDAETNRQAQDGQVITEIGVAIARPAEFVIFRISQFSAPAK